MNVPRDDLNQCLLSQSLPIDMASHGIVGSKRPLEEPEDAEFEPAKKFKTSELPLNSTQRSAVDSLVHTIKKKGIYDTLRKQVWAQYAASVGISEVAHCLGVLWCEQLS